MYGLCLRALTEFLPPATHHLLQRLRHQYRRNSLQMETSEKDVEQETIEHVKAETLSLEISSPAEKRLLWKLDIHVVPILMVLFLLAFLDRINIGNARLQGLEADLDMGGRDYNIALLIFFIPYVLLEVPSNLILKRFAPSWWLSGIMFGWGLFSLFTRMAGADYSNPRDRHYMPGPHCKLWWLGGLSLLVGGL